MYVGSEQGPVVQRNDNKEQLMAPLSRNLGSVVMHSF